jgi:pyruvate dehydrogenase complex dehydrogenase (E1) component
MNETPAEQKIRFRAAYLRKRFLKHSLAVQEIVSSLTDQQICDLHANHHQTKIEVLKTNAEEKC